MNELSLNHELTNPNSNKLFVKLNSKIQKMVIGFGRMNWVLKTTNNELVHVRFTAYPAQPLAICRWPAPAGMGRPHRPPLAHLQAGRGECHCDGALLRGVDEGRNACRGGRVCVGGAIYPEQWPHGWASRRGCAVGVVWRVLWGMGVMVSSAEGSLGGRGQRGALWEMGQSRLHSMKCPKLAFCAAAVSSNLYLNNWEIFVTCAILFYIVQPPL